MNDIVANMHENIKKKKGRWESFDDIDNLGHGCGCLLKDRNGNIWVGTSTGLSRYDSQNFVNFTYQEGLAGDYIQCLHQDEEGNIWIGTQNGLSRYLYEGEGREGQSFVNFTYKDRLAGDNVRCVYQDGNGNIWIGTLGNGVSCYDGIEFVNFSTKDGLAGNDIYDIIQDREGSLWFACEHGGLSRYNPYEILYISDEYVREVMIQDKSGNLWWGFGNILSQLIFKGSDVNEVEHVNHYPFKYGILELFEDSQGRLWVGTRGGLFIYDNIKDFTRIGQGKPCPYIIRNLTVDDGLPNNEIWRIYEDRDGNIWLGTAGGLSKYDSRRFINYTTDDGLGNNHVSVICQDRAGIFWFAGWNGGGLSSYDGKSFHKYTTNDGLADDRIIHIVVDDSNNLWIATAAGISYYDRKALTFRNYTKEDGLLSNLTQRMLQDRKGHLWIATLGGGVNRFDGKNFQALTTADGLPGNNVTGIIEAGEQGTGDREQENPKSKIQNPKLNNSQSAIRNPQLNNPQSGEGSFIISTYRGIVRYVPDYKTPPLIRIDEVDADRVYRVYEELDKDKAIEISESVKSLKIKYHGISFKTKRMRYNYILQGYDEDWKATWDEEVRYENLPLGEYKFKVIAINRDLVYSEQLAELRLRVIADPRDKVIDELERKVRERTKELEAANEILQDRSLQLQEAYKELESFSYSISHDLRAPLRAIDGFSRLLFEKYAPQLSDEASRYLKIVRDNIRQMGQLIDDLLNFSRLSRQPLNKKTVAPADLVRQVLNDLRQEQKARHVEVVIGELPPCQADPSMLKQVFVNLISNAFKFTRKMEAAVIEIGCRTEVQGHKPKESIYFVKDNGVGFDMRYADKLFGVFQRLHRAEEYEGTGVGLAIVQRIILRHGGRVWAEAEVNKGATFYFTLENVENVESEGGKVHE